MRLYLENIDEKKTIKAAQEILLRYRVKILTADEEILPRITSTFTLEAPSKSVEKVVIKKVDKERETLEFFAYLNRGLKKLTSTERQILAMSFFEEEPYYDYQIADELKFSVTTFGRRKKAALLKLGLALNVAVYKKEEESNEQNI